MNTGDKARDTSSSVHRGNVIAKTSWSTRSSHLHHPQQTIPSRRSLSTRRNDLLDCENTQKSQAGEKLPFSVSILANRTAEERCSGQPHCRVTGGGLAQWLLGAGGRPAPGQFCVGACLGSLSATRSYSGIYFLLYIFRVVEDVMKDGNTTLQILRGIISPAWKN
jgi:hypothetical protein